MRWWKVGLLLAVVMGLGACRQQEGPQLAWQGHLVDSLEEELKAPPTEQDQERLQALLEELRQEFEEQERIREQQSRVIEALLKRLEKASPSGHLSLRTGPVVVEVQFSFDTLPRDRDGDGTQDYVYVTVWPKDGARDTVKAVGTMRFVLSRRPPFDFGVRGEVLQSWRREPEAVDEAWQDAWVFDGHHFELPLEEGARAAGKVVLEVSYIAADGRELTAKKALEF